MDQLPVIQSNGLGWDSLAALTCWLDDPTSRDFDLDDLIVLSAQVGNESRQTKEFIEREIYPRLRAARVRTVQVARGGLHEADGIVVLDDTREPITCYTEGAYKLSDELMRAGTVPQYANGRRRCTLKFKGWVLDEWIKREMGDRPFRHVMGFNADEMRRVEKDRSFSTTQRRSEYPLVEWGWGREKGNAWRSVRAVERGPRDEMVAIVADTPGSEAGPGGARLYEHRRGEEYPTREGFYVAAPATVADKERPSFAKKWRECDQLRLL